MSSDARAAAGGVYGPSMKITPPNRRMREAIGRAMLTVAYTHPRLEHDRRLGASS